MAVVTIRIISSFADIAYATADLFKVVCILHVLLCLKFIKLSYVLLWLLMPGHHRVRGQNYIVLSPVFLMNVFIALEGTYAFLFFFSAVIVWLTLEY